MDEYPFVGSTDKNYTFLVYGDSSMPQLQPVITITSYSWSSKADKIGSEHGQHGAESEKIHFIKI